jgi:hypothetical protein
MNESDVPNLPAGTALASEEMDRRKAIEVKLTMCALELEKAWWSGSIPALNAILTPVFGDMPPQHVLDSWKVKK